MTFNFHQIKRWTLSNFRKKCGQLWKILSCWWCSLLFSLDLFWLGSPSIWFNWSFGWQWNHSADGYIGKSTIISFTSFGCVSILKFKLKLFAYFNHYLIAEATLLLDWSGSKCSVYTDDETWLKMGSENSLLIMNHSNELDWLIVWVMSQQCNILGVSRNIYLNTFRASVIILIQTIIVIAECKAFY